MFEYPNPGIEMVRAGRIRPLAVAAPQRLEGLPGVPTMAEEGVRGVEAETWFALFGPQGLPPEVLERLEREAAAIVAGPDFAGFLERQGALPVALRGEPFRAFIAAEVEKWRAFGEATGFRVD